MGILSYLNTTNSCDGKYGDSIDVRFTKVCDNDCSFCIEKDGIDSLGKTNVEKMIEETVKSGKQSVLILGGEPFLKIKELNLYVKGIRSHVREIYITTSIPKTLDIEDELVVEVLDLIDGLNVSLQHYNPTINNEVLNASNRFNRIDKLESILAKGYADKIRVSVNLCKGFIDSSLKINLFLYKMRTIGCKHIKINELQEVDENMYVSFEEEFGVRLKSPYAFGCQTDISDMFCFGMTVTLKRSCFKVQPKKYAQNNVSVFDLIKVLYRKFSPANCDMCVLYENGDVSNGWKIKGGR